MDADGDDPPMGAPAVTPGEDAALAVGGGDTLAPISVGAALEAVVGAAGLGTDDGRAGETVVTVS